MGILTEKEIIKITSQIGMMASGINYVPLMIKDNNTIVYNKQEKIVFFIKNNNIWECYKKISQQEFQDSIEELKKDGWEIL
jgi:hypothetical protein